LTFAVFAPVARRATRVCRWMYLEYIVYEIENFKYKQNVVGRMAGGLYLTR